VPLDLSVSVDWRVLLYTFALSVGAGVLFGLAPAWAATRPMLSSALKGEDALARPGRRWTLRNTLIVSQIAMSLVLLCATGLFLRSMERASGIDIGFRSRGILMMSVDPRVHGYTAERTTQFLTELRQRVADLPGVISAACTDSVPLSGGNRSDAFHVEGRPSTASDTGCNFGPHGSRRPDRTLRLRLNRPSCNRRADRVKAWLFLLVPAISRVAGTWQAPRPRRSYSIISPGRSLRRAIWPCLAARLGRRSFRSFFA
jgi:hypothetical protein